MTFDQWLEDSEWDYDNIEVLRGHWDALVAAGAGAELVAAAFEAVAENVEDDDEDDDDE